jgi:CBS domain-containing protein
MDAEPIVSLPRFLLTLLHHFSASHDIQGLCVELSSRSENSSVVAAVAHNALTSVIEFLSQHAPFDRLTPAHLEFLAQQLRLGFYAAGEVIMEPAEGAARHFYIIKQGRVRGEISAIHETENNWMNSTAGEDKNPDPAVDEAVLVTGECFPVGALLADHPVHTVHRAVEDTFCFELDLNDFQKLLEESTVFRNFCTRRLASLLDQALESLQAQVATKVASGETSLNAPLSRIVRRAPVTCRPQTPIRAVLQTMNAERIGSMVITDASLKPLGVFTLHDLLWRVVNSSVDRDAPIETVMTRSPLSLPPDAFGYQAVELVARMGFGHVCVVENDRLVGVVSERDLFSLQRVGLVQLSRAIKNAPDVATLARLGEDIHRVIDQMLAQGASVAQLTKIISQFNDHVTRRVITLSLDKQGMPSCAFAWLSFGSEGREEQTLKTDQDNGILFVPASGANASAVREELLPVAHRINQALDECGFPLCPGNIMASNPECCLSLEEWKTRFQHWIEHGSPMHLLKASIYFDFRAIYGDRTPVDELRRWVAERVAKNDAFLHQMAENALGNSPPLGLVRDFIVESGGEHPNTINLKLRGTSPFVDGARLLALAHGITDTSTAGRLRATAAAGGIPDEEAEAWCDAFDFIQLLRMRAHQKQASQGLTLDNHINPDTLNDLDRRILKEAFRQARKLQQRLALDY